MVFGHLGVDVGRGLGRLKEGDLRIIEEKLRGSQLVEVQRFGLPNIRL